MSIFSKAKTYYADVAARKKQARQVAELEALLKTLPEVMQAREKAGVAVGVAEQEMLRLKSERALPAKVEQARLNHTREIQNQERPLASLNARKAKLEQELETRSAKLRNDTAESWRAEIKGLNGRRKAYETDKRINQHSEKGGYLYTVEHNHDSVNKVRDLILQAIGDLGEYRLSTFEALEKFIEDSEKAFLKIDIDKLKRVKDIPETQRDLMRVNVAPHQTDRPAITAEEHNAAVEHMIEDEKKADKFAKLKAERDSGVVAYPAPGAKS